MLTWLLKVPGEIAQALLRTLFAEKDLLLPARSQPRVRLALPDTDSPQPPSVASAPTIDQFQSVLSSLRQEDGYRTAEELAAKTQLRPWQVRDLFATYGASHVDVRLREEPDRKVAEFRARPSA